MNKTENRYIKINPFIKNSIIFCISLYLLIICSCADDKNNNDTDSNIPAISFILKGQFIDTYVQGLKYRTCTQTGITDNRGYFNYKQGETIEFSIGNTKIGTCIAKQILTPMDMANATEITNTKVLNISRLLQSLDLDGNLDNGIQLHEMINEELETQIDFSQCETDFENNTEIQNLFSSLNSMQVFTDNKTRVLYSAEEAKSHLEQSLSSASHFPFCILESGQPLDRAKNVSSSLTSNMNDLVNHLIEGYENSFEKTKVLHDWIALNISYDYDMYQSGNYASMDAESVFYRKTGVCEGYSNLFLEFCNIAQIPCKKISGKTKG